MMDDLEKVKSVFIGFLFFCFIVLALGFIIVNSSTELRIILAIVLMHFFYWVFSKLTT